MIELLQFTNDIALAQRCEALGGIRLVIDWERNGKAERQAGRNTFISTHTVADLHAIRAACPKAQVMVRVNPLFEGSADEVGQAIAAGADRLMLPMFKSAAQLQEFVRLVHGRVPVSALLEHVDALNCLDEWVAMPGLDEVYVGLNDLHLSLGHAFMFEPLADGTVQRVLQQSRAAGKRVGFGGIARMDEGELPGKVVLAEHLRLHSQAVILSRTFHRFDVGGSDSLDSLDQEIAKLRQHETALRQRTEAEIELHHQQAVLAIGRIAQRIGANRPAWATH